MPAPIWMRDSDGLLTFVNSAYVRAVEAKDASEAQKHVSDIVSKTIEALKASTKRNCCSSDMLRQTGPATKRAICGRNCATSSLGTEVL